MTDDGTDTGGHLQIGAVATETGLSIKTIRHYDEVGVVVPSARSAGGFRLYTRADIDRLLVIRRMKPLGFTLDDMRELLAAEDVLDDSAAPRADRQVALDALSEFRDRASHACARLERQLDYAREFTAQLSDRLSDVPGAGSGASGPNSMHSAGSGASGPNSMHSAGSGASGPDSTGAGNSFTPAATECP